MLFGSWARGDAGPHILKALLVYHGQKPAYTHDLILLLTKCAEIEPRLADLESSCDSLTAYAAESRYPDDFHTPDAEEGRAAAAVRRVREHLLALLPPHKA